MSQLKHGAHGALDTPEPNQSVQRARAQADELQHINQDVAAARHLTAIRIRGQLAELDGEDASA